LEGGAHVISEAIACGTPVVASEIPGNVGMLGRDYPAYFPVGNTEKLSQLLRTCENDPGYLNTLRKKIQDRAWMVDPAEESKRWEKLLRTIESRYYDYQNQSRP
ncbi:MAG: glycosyltransferase, partial [bacterium]